MDYLLVQATSVPCEHIFSSAKETDTVKQNHMSPLLMEALQLLKFALKKQHLDFIDGWAMPKMAMSRRSEPDCDLGTLFTKDPDATVDDILKGMHSYD